MPAPVRDEQSVEPARQATEAVPAAGQRQSEPPMAPKPLGAGPPRWSFTRGDEKPRGVAWYGVRSFWGHSRHLAASAIATEDIDSRDWMTPDDPRELVQRIAAALGATKSASTLTECLGRDLWIDYVADTGDDVSVSRAVARLLFAEYVLPDPAQPDQRIATPRGDILFFGGDTAYPVATAEEIKSRVVVPFNQVLVERPRDRLRVLLGIPGNHDWYDGLDGFARMFRRPGAHYASGTAAATHDARKTRFGQYADFARQFVIGGHVSKPRSLELEGYVRVQNASYFALHVAPSIGLIAADRQLKKIDSRQAHYFQSWLNNHLGVSPWVFLPDPVYAFGEPSPSGTGMLESLGLRLGSRPHLILSGDIHHYRREHEGPTLHVTAGGGGAFLHPAAFHPGRPAEVEWPDIRQSRALLPSVPIRIALGRAGFLPHLLLAVVFAPSIVLLGSRGARTSDLAALGATVLLFAISYGFLGGVRRNPRVLLLSTLAGILTAPTPFIVFYASRPVLHAVGLGSERWLVALVALTVAAFSGAFVFGAYIAALTLFGMERTQAFTALDHPGFKHFVRLRVRADGSAIDGWCLGLVDPLANDSKPVLVDQFTWRPLK